MRVKRKLFLTTAFAALLGVGAFAGVSLSKEAAKPAEVKAAANTIDIYFTKPGLNTYDNAWNSTINLHYWGGSSESQWPGVDMVDAYINSSGQQVVKASIPSDTTSIIFSGLQNGQYRDQTANITSGVANNKGFYLTGGAWGSRTVGSWTVEFYTLAFNANGGTGEMTSHNAVRDIDWGVPDSSFTRSGYAFNGWNTKANGSGTSYAAGSTIKKNTQVAGSTLTLYAQWREIEFHIVGSNKGSWNPSAAGAIKFTAFSSNKYKAEELTFTSNETWKVIKGSDGWVDSGYNGNTDIFNSYMTMDGTNVKVTSAGAAFAYSVYITVDSSFNVTEVWVAFFYNAEKFCAELMAATNDICSNATQGHNASLLKPVWNTLYGKLSNYPACEIKKMHDAIASEGGTEIEVAMARYDRICQLYGTALEQSPKTYDYNFLNRSGAAASLRIATILQANIADSATTIIIIAISATCLAAIGGYFLFKKKKEN